MILYLWNCTECAFHGHGQYDFPDWVEAYVYMDHGHLVAVTVLQEDDDR